jgi:aspartyl-tRNA(Asn)/glutamyl-tRNA(Gln) amidotransferase subunit A
VTLDPYNAFLHRPDEAAVLTVPGTVKTLHVAGNDEGFFTVPGTVSAAGWRVGVKDVIDVAGMPTTAASKVLHRIPQRDAACVARLRAAGAAVVGKLNTHEFAFGALTNSPHFGPVRNPWDLERTTGGSSGGSGAAVAAGLVDLALGTDTAGSIRIPAALCGVTGHRPTVGLIPTEGVVPVAWTLDTVGPLARTSEECRRAVEIMAGRPLQPAGDVRRVGIVTRLFEQADPAVAAACEEAARALPGKHEPVELPLLDEIATITQLVMLPEAAAAHLHWLRTRLADYGPDVRARLLAGLLLPSTAYLTGLRARSWVRAEWERRLGGFDLLVAPAMPIVAPRLDAIQADYRLLIMPYNSPAALLGLPVTVAPCGVVDGLPVGLALMGRQGEDGVTLAAADAFQQATDWHGRRPVDAAPGEVLYTTDTAE